MAKKVKSVQKSSGEKETVRRKKTHRFINFSELSERELSLDGAIVEAIESAAKKIGKNGAKVDQNGLLASLAFQEADRLKFRPTKLEKMQVKFTIPNDLWKALDAAALRNKASLEETISNLVKAL